MTRSAARLNSGRVADVEKAQAEVATTTQVDAKVDRLVAKLDQEDNGFTAGFNRQSASVTGQYGKLNATIRSANPTSRPTSRTP